MKNVFAQNNEECPRCHARQIWICTDSQCPHTTKHTKQRTELQDWQSGRQEDSPKQNPAPTTR